MRLQCGRYTVDLSRPQVMGILNVTPDSFSDGGDFFARDRALAHAEALIEEGAAFIDVGGESTRPGAAPVSVQEELDRVIPVVEALAAVSPVPVSVDTSKPEVMRAAVAAGATLINDVRALRVPGALEAAAELAVPVCLMHMRGTPQTMQDRPRYDDVVAEVTAFLADRVRACEAAGIARERLVIDPGFGFAKTAEHNLILLRHLDRLRDLDLPILVGLSRKSTLGSLLQRPVQDRLHASVAAGTVAAWQGAHIVRAHDVAATVDALRVCAAVRDLPGGEAGAISAV